MSVSRDVQWRLFYLIFSSKIAELIPNNSEKKMSQWYFIWIEEEFKIDQSTLVVLYMRIFLSFRIDVDNHLHHWNIEYVHPSFHHYSFLSKKKRKKIIEFCV